MYTLIIKKENDVKLPSGYSQWDKVLKISTQTLDVPALVQFILSNGSLREHSPTNPVYQGLKGLEYIINPEKHGLAGETPKQP
jgi:hypothetical protein